MSEEQSTRFRLHTLFLVVAVGAVCSEFVRWSSTGGETPFFAGLAAFFYGGLLAIASYVMVGVGFILALHTVVFLSARQDGDEGQTRDRPLVFATEATVLDLGAEA